MYDKPEGAIDATGLENRQTSQYYVRRSGYKRFLRVFWPKLTAVCDTGTHLFSACRLSRGLSDAPECSGHSLCRLWADVAYDGEHNHPLCREFLRIRQTIIPLNPQARKKDA